MLTLECTSDDVDPIKIVIKNIVTMKPKEDPVAGSSEKKEYILYINFRPRTAAAAGDEEPEQEHVSLQFSDREIRDAWEHGIRNIMTGKGAVPAKDNVYVPAQPLVPITKIGLKNGSTAEELMTVVVDVGDKNNKQILFPVSAPAAGVDQEIFKKELWEKVVNFVEDNFILQTETMSLFRYMRTVVQRALMEKEVATMISDINSQSLRKLMENRGKLEPGVLGDDELHAAAEKRLDVLLAQLPERIGQSSGAPVVTQVLRRNIEKMKLMNGMVLKLAAAAPAEGASEHPTDGRASPNDDIGFGDLGLGVSRIDYGLGLKL